MSLRITLAVLVAALGVPLGAGQDSSQQSPAPAQPFASGTTAIVVDVVVRDEKGHPVTDLRKEDFELLEDGVRQEIADVTLVAPAETAGGSSGSGTSASPRAGAAGRRAITTPTFVALVFDRLTPEARALAHQGALAYLDTFHEDDFAGVFLSDMSLVQVQTYTNDRARIRRAIDQAASRATSVFDRASTRDIGEETATGDAHPSVPDVASAEFVGRPVDQRVGGGSVPTGLLTKAMFNTWEQLSRERQGYATTNALLALTSSLGLLPGRKTIVLFAEALAIPDAVLPHFRHVVATANRANVSVYTIDAAGLRVHSSQAETGRHIRAMGGAGITLNPDGSNQSSTGMLITNEDVLRRDPRTSLTLLAEGTGGFLVENTNDLARAFRTIDADRRFHYLLTYSPKNDAFAGEWRTISVKVPGREVTVRARSGYLAVRTPAAIPLLAYEGPALAALDAAPSPRDIAVNAAAFVFPGAPENRLAVLASTPGAGLTFARDEKAGQFRTDFTILARIRNADGEIVRKASVPYRLNGPLAQLEQNQRGDVLFFRQPTLPAGSYALEVAVHDALARRAGVQTAQFTVPPATGGLQVSSLVIVGRGERVPPSEWRETDNPLYVGDVLLYPNLGEPIRRADRAVTFFFVATSKSPAVLTATLEVIRADQTLATLPIALEKPDENGSIKQVAQLPTSQLPIGSYTLRLAITHSGGREVREARFSLVD